MSDPYAIPPKNRAAEGIRWYILSHGLAAGDRLPPERALCEQLGVSRTALRGAITVLESQHVLESRQGSGTYVCPKKPLMVFQRAGSFSDTVRAAGMRPSDRIISSGVFEAGEILAAKLGVPVGTSVFEFCRLRSADGVPVALETSYVNRSICEGIENHDYEHESLYRVLREEFGICVGNSHERISVTRVNAYEAELLQVEEDSPALYARGSERTAARVPIEYTKAVIVASRFRFASDEKPRIEGLEVGDTWLKS